MRRQVKTMMLVGAVLAVLANTSAVSEALAAEIPAGKLEKLVGLYVPMQEALAGDSAAAVQAQAAKVAAEAEAILKSKGEKPTLDAIEDLEAIVTAAKEMKGPEIEALRAQFKPLSRSVGRLVERQAVAGHGIYFCPMADAYWVQKSGAVKNPYYGAKMLACGEAVAKVAD
jgi:hypothetical protein